MQVTKIIDGGKAVMKLSGRFDFNTHRDFREGFEAILKNADVRSLDLDFSDVDYMDSSALGMLLLLNERAMARNISLSLVGCAGVVKQILDIANFGKLFTIR